jgi:hypothetical protein
MTTNDLIDGAIGIVQDLPVHAERLADWALRNAWWVALIAVGAGLVVGAGWWLSRRPMPERTALQVLPTTGFDPKPEEVVRFGRQIALAHKSVSRWLLPARRGTAVRVRFASSGGALSMRVEGPTKAMSVLRHQGYAQVEMRPVEASGRAVHEHPQIQLASQNPS